jgi:hypothetical protein
MSARDLDTAPPTTPLTLRWPPNWTAVIFFATLAFLHITICVPAFFYGRWEGYMSVIFAMIFGAITIGCLRIKSQLIVDPREKLVRVRTSLARFISERAVPFASIRAVRVTICSEGRRPESRIELLCPGEDIECPPTDIPREQGLFLAMTLDAPLIKVFAEGVQATDRLGEL